MTDRRAFLSGLATLPLIGGSVALIGKSTMASIQLTQVAAAPLLSDPRQRARYAWEAFSAAMREIRPDAHGWFVSGGERLPFGTMKGDAWVMPKSIYYETGTEPRCPSLIVERWNDLDLKGGAA